ncbi:hypothetical protein AOL_s00173g354 [Orbilia oligospora ATCC 24927]|uniref:Uncharacterized protein n=1 Tax=Arthrobotrys oligospora (strain ATCC 24927 / CBS 115.81 / DSM 1491) TaxID=756982 RepID=G1XPI6_ARTOA|nr:hypothetical protein AOL_s00173g354 [Orbilia oligospora ATCC 24927]EGX45253.1 hypothetical protein AOL_s00173g354 [Orbilia oligospora ATCC 24927]
MKLLGSSLLLLLAVLPAGFAQTTTDDHDGHAPAPSPTESSGCEPHGDHWHCTGPRVDRAITTAPPTSTPVATVTTDDHDHHTDDDDDDHDHTGTLAPSPTESVGCEAHGDHWHCEGPVAVTTTAAKTTSHDHEEGEGTLAPSPTGSVGCEAHGDHWHCAGPREATTTTTSASHGTGSGTLAPSPAESVGCEAHGDHWHCDGPRTTIASTTTSTPTNSTPPALTSSPAGGAGVARATVVVIAPLAAIIGLALAL